GTARAGLEQLGVRVAASGAVGWRGCVGIHGTGWQPVPAVVLAGGPAAGRVGGRAGRVRLGRSAVDPGQGRHADRPAVPRAVHPAGDLVPVTPHRVQPADAGPPRRGTQRDDERNETTIITWRTETWAKVRGLRRRP